MQTHMDSSRKREAIYWFNFLFTVAFAVEVILKIIAFTPAVRNKY